MAHGRLAKLRSQLCQDSARVETSPGQLEGSRRVRASLSPDVGLLSALFNQSHGCFATQSRVEPEPEPGVLPRLLCGLFRSTQNQALAETCLHFKAGSMHHVGVAVYNSQSQLRIVYTKMPAATQREDDCHHIRQPMISKRPQTASRWNTEIS